MMLDPLPVLISCCGKKYRLKADFRRVLMMLEIQKDRRLTPDARTTLCLRCVFRRIPGAKASRRDLLRETYKALFPGGKRGNAQALTDIDQDADLIRSAFRQSYGIDLRRARLHWLEFAELLANLPEGSRYAEVISVRAMPVPESTKYNAKYRQSVIEAKAAFALQSQGEKERMEKYRQNVRSVAAGLIALAKR